MGPLQDEPDAAIDFFEIAPENEPVETERARRLERSWQAVVVLRTISEGEVTLRLDGQGG